MTTRRAFLATCALAFQAAALAQPAWLRRRGRLERVGIQLYTVRALMQRDLELTLEQLARIGYTEVEFAGYFGRRPDSIGALLNAHGLTSPSTHIAYPADDAEWKGTLDEAAAAGHEWAVIAWLDAALRRRPDDWHRLADRFNALGRMARDAGLRLAYHNHDFVFDRVGDRTGYDVLLDGTDPDLVNYEMDVYWTVKGGADPLALMRRYPRRFPLLHLKDAKSDATRSMTDVGSGSIDWSSILAMQATSGARHVFVEHDEPADPLASARASYEYLHALRY